MHLINPLLLFNNGDFRPPGASGGTIIFNVPFEGSEGSTAVVDTTGNTSNITVVTGFITTSIARRGASSFRGRGTSVSPLTRVQCDTASFFDPGAGAFTVEFWAYPVSNAGTQNYVVFAAPSNGARQHRIHIGSGRWFLSFSRANGTAASISGPLIVVNQWQHIAISYTGTTIFMHIDGILVGSSAQQFFSAPCNIGLAGHTLTPTPNPTANIFPMDGFMDAVRITSGVARYTQNQHLIDNAP